MSTARENWRFNADKFLRETAIFFRPKNGWNSCANEKIPEHQVLRDFLCVVREKGLEPSSLDA